MPTQADRAARFADLHRAGTPLVLVNAWDPGSARIIQEAGARAIATASWAVAASLGHADGEHVPLPLVLDHLQRIVTAVDLPVSLDFERGYGETPGDVAASVEAALICGAIGFNIEDGLETGLRPAQEQAERLAAARASAAARAIPAFINARTDVFLTDTGLSHDEAIEEVLHRAAIYAGAGADGLFVPGLKDLDMITTLVHRSPLPVNVMRALDGPSVASLAACGVVRISHGPNPWRHAMAALRSAAESLLG